MDINLPISLAAIVVPTRQLTLGAMKAIRDSTYRRMRALHSARCRAIVHASETWIHSAGVRRRPCVVLAVTDTTMILAGVRNGARRPVLSLLRSKASLPRTWCKRMYRDTIYHIPTEKKSYNKYKCIIFLLALIYKQFIIGKGI